jgi:signal transduction histidine kinase
MGISDLRDDVAQSIENAKADLDKALAELERIPTVEPAALSFVAHAMGNYMNVTGAVLDLLTNALGDHPDAEVRQWLEGLHHLLDMTHQTVARLLRVYEPKQMPLQFDHMKLEVLMERACAYHRRSAAQKQIEIVCRTAGYVPQVWADRVAVAVVADNLLSNAIKFSNPGGRIDVQIMPSPGGAVCSVADHGPGLTPLMQAQIFERGSITERRPFGAEAAGGYGLVVAKAFIDRLGGRLWSDSEPGKGACFSFRLPYRAPEGVARESRATGG